MLSIFTGTWGLQRACGISVDFEAHWEGKMTKTLTKWLLLAAPYPIGSHCLRAATRQAQRNSRDCGNSRSGTSHLAQSAAAAVSRDWGRASDLGITESRSWMPWFRRLSSQHCASNPHLHEGIGQSLSAPNADPAIAVNVNDVYIPAEMTGSAFYDLDRVEVLPGPQGTLYGRNAAGGVVNLITHRPTRIRRRWHTRVG